MTSGDPFPSEPAGNRPPGQYHPGSPRPMAGQPPPGWGPPGQQGPGAYPPPGQPYQHPDPRQHPGSHQYPPPGQPYPPPGRPRAGVPVPGWLNPRDEWTWAMAAHLSALVGLFIGLSFVGPLVVLLKQGARSPYVRANAVESLNFNLSVLLYMIVSFLLVFVFIGIPLMVGVGIAWLVLTAVAALKAGNGEPYRYPLTIRMVS